MNLFKQFETNKQKESDGVWVEYGKNEDDSPIRFCIARISTSNKKYQKALQRASKPYSRQIQMETLSEEVSQEIMLEVFTKTILLGWENINDRDGNPIEFSQKAAMELLRELPDLYEDLLDNAKKASLFRDLELEENAGN